MKDKWVDYFIGMARYVATKSEDRSTKVGVVIVGPDNEIRSTGYNGFPRKVLDREVRHSRPQKYLYTEHAERNAIYNAARIGTPLKDCTIFMNYGPAPCSDCMRGIIQSGIIRIVHSGEYFPGLKEKWEEHFKVSIQMIEEAGIEVYDAKFDQNT